MPEHFQLQTVMTLGGVTRDEAAELVEVIDRETLLSGGWSHSSDRELRNAIGQARLFVANGRSWEV